MGKHVDGFPDKDGIERLVKLAKALCALVATFSALILRKYPGNETITKTLAAIAIVCALIPELESDFLETGGDNSLPISDPEDIPGIDPGKPPAGEPTT